MTLWEVTIAEGLKSVGYATALFGKWHLGGANWLGRRSPIDQGFDEWYGIPNTSNDAQVTTSPTFNAATTDVPYIWEQKAGEPARKAKEFRFVGDSVLVRRDGDAVILEPADDWPDGYVASFAGVPDAFARLPQGTTDRRGRIG